MTYIQILTTTEKKEDAEKIAKVILEKRLAACVQILGPIYSSYWWENNIEKKVEWICIIKTRNEKYNIIERTILSVHPYKVPEILVIPILSGNKSYFDWLNKEINR